MDILDQHGKTVGLRTTLIFQNRNQAHIPKGQVRHLIVWNPTLASNNDISTRRKAPRIRKTIGNLSDPLASMTRVLCREVVWETS
jgi:hypothetical protein